MAIHKSLILDTKSTNDDIQKEVLKLLGGIDSVLVLLLHQNLLSESQLTKLKAVFATKLKLANANDDMENILSEVLADHDKEQFGKMQSPINIITSFDCGHTKIMKDQEYKKSPLKFSYPPFVYNCSIMNNGHTVQVNIDPMNKCMVAIKGKEYKLVQFHFHTPSEHCLDGKQYDMEMHLVHVNEKNEIAVLGFIFTKKQRYQRPKLELTQSRAHLVLSKMLINTEISMQPVDEETDVDTDDDWEDDAVNGGKKKKKAARKPNDFLDQFWSQLPAKKTEKDIMLDTPISFDYLFETSSNNFVKDIESNEINIDMEIFEYMGSLTTPPYTEGVQWMVSKKTHFIEKKQLKKLSACWGNMNNARECQDYCGRTVQLRSQSSLKVVL